MPKSQSLLYSFKKKELSERKRFQEIVMVALNLKLATNGMYELSKAERCIVQTEQLILSMRAQPSK